MALLCVLYIKSSDGGDSIMDVCDCRELDRMFFYTFFTYVVTEAFLCKFSSNNNSK